MPTLHACSPCLTQAAPKDTGPNVAVLYVQELSKSFEFYAAQRSGYLGKNYVIDWRGDSALTDVSPTGSSLVGGYYDNGGEQRLFNTMHKPACLAASALHSELTLLPCCAAKLPCSHWRLHSGLAASVSLRMLDLTTHKQAATEKLHRHCCAQLHC